MNVPFTYAGSYLSEPAGYSGAGAPSIAVTAPDAGATVTGSAFTLNVDVRNFTLCQECKL